MFTENTLFITFYNLWDAIELNICLLTFQSDATDRRPAGQEKQKILRTEGQMKLYYRKKEKYFGQRSLPVG